MERIGVFWIYVHIERLLKFFLNRVLLMFSREEKQFAAYFCTEILPLWTHVHFQPKVALIFYIDFLSFMYNLNSKGCKWYLNCSSGVNVLEIFIAVTENMLPNMHTHSKAKRLQLIRVIKTNLWEADTIVQNEHTFLETKLSLPPLRTWMLFNLIPGGPTYMKQATKWRAILQLHRVQDVY